MKHAVTSGIGILAICMTGCSNSVTAKLYPVKKGALPGAAPDSGGSSARGRCAAELRDVTVTLPTGETRSFIEDGDTVIMRAWCERPGYPRIGFGECAGTVVPAV